MLLKYFSEILDNWSTKEEAVPDFLEDSRSPGKVDPSQSGQVSWVWTICLSDRGGSLENTALWPHRGTGSQFR